MNEQSWCRVRPKKSFQLSVWTVGFALPPQGSHPVPQPAAETGARHLLVGLEGSQTVHVLLLFCCFSHLTSWNFQESPSCAVSARTVKWLAGRSFVNERSWRPGRAFNSSGLVTGNLKNAMLACWLWVGYGWKRLGQRCFEIRCFVFGLSCWRHALFGSGNSEVSVCAPSPFFRSLSGIATLLKYVNILQLKLEHTSFIFIQALQKLLSPAQDRGPPRKRHSASCKGRTGRLRSSGLPQRGFWPWHPGSYASPGALEEISSDSMMVLGQVWSRTCLIV